MEEELMTDGKKSKKQELIFTNGVGQLNVTDGIGLITAIIDHEVQDSETGDKNHVVRRIVTARESNVIIGTLIPNACADVIADKGKILNFMALKNRMLDLLVNGQPIITENWYNKKVSCTISWSIEKPTKTG